MTISLNRSIADGNPRLLWLVGNAQLTNYSGLLLGAHLAHAGLIMFWAGITTIGEVLRYQPDVPFGEQGFLLLPHLATLGWGVGSNSQIIETDTYFAIGMIHVVSAAVLAAGGLFHIVRTPNLATGSPSVARFHYEWTDAKQLGLILGHHLILLGIGAWLLVVKATDGGGIYDPAVHQVRLITNPNLDPSIIFGYLVGWNHGEWNPQGMASVNNLEDVVGGHIWIAAILILGGIWHILVPPFTLVKRWIRIEADAILSYSLAGLALMAGASSVFVGFNTTVFPVEFYGADRTTLAAVQFFLGVVALVGHLWHSYRSRTN